MKRPLLCLVTDRRRLSPDAHDDRALDALVLLIGAAAAAGIDLIQIRERDLQARELARLTERSVSAVAGRGSKVIVNDRVDVALAAGADGVHLRSDSIDAASARKLVPAEFTVGQSVHSAREAAGKLQRGGVDYVVFGTMFPTASKPRALAPAAVDCLEELGRACAAVPVPVLAIGGIDAHNAEAVARAGASGIAAIGLFIPPPGTRFDRHLENAVAGVRRAFDTSGAVP